MDGIDQLLELKNKIVGLPDAMPGLLQSSFNNLGTLVEDLIIDQLNKGQRGDGSFLPDYSPVSVMVFGKRPGPMTLEHTGAFHRGIRMIVTNEGIDFEGTDVKTDMLQTRYGDDIIDLQEGNQEIVEQQYLKRELEVEQLPKYFGL